MRKNALMGVLLLLLLCFFSMTPACAEGFPAGEWAFSSEPDVPVLRIGEDGSALYKGIAYQFEDDGRFLILTGEEGEVLRLRYLVTEKAVYLYVNSSYSRKEGTAGEGIVGVWNMDGSETSFFEFTKNGRFLEDGVFDGTYQVDEEEGSFRLIYTMYFSNTVCYYLREGEHMSLEYPWSLKEIREETAP